MPTILALLIWTAATTPLPPVDGALLHVGDACYTIAGSGGDNGSAGKILRRVERIDAKRLMIAVASRFNGGPLLTSRMEVAFPSLRPIRTVEETDGRIGLTVRYAGTHVRGTLFGDAGRKETRRSPLSGPVWDEETMEFVLTTLPLAEGAHFELPMFHFGRGSGVMRVDVRGSAVVQGPDGRPMEAWEVQGSTRSDVPIIFMIAKADRRLLEVDAGGVRSYLGGDCSGMIP